MFVFEASSYFKITLIEVKLKLQVTVVYFSFILCTFIFYLYAHITFINEKQAFKTYLYLYMNLKHV